MRPTKPDFDHIEQLALDLDIAGDEGETLSPMIDAQAQLEAMVSTSKQLQGEVGETQDWLPDYRQIRDLGWNWKVSAYIAWASCPKNKRWPATLDKLATEVLNLSSARVIYKWRAKNPAIDEVVATLQAAPLYAHRADIYAALVTSASSPDYKHFQDRRLALELMGDYVARQVVDDRRSAKDLSELSSEQLREMAGKLDAEGEADGEGSIED